MSELYNNLGHRVVARQAELNDLVLLLAVNVLMSN